MSALEDRVAALEARLDALQAAPVRPTAPGPLWVLAGLHEREPGGAVVLAGSVATADGPVEWQIGLPAAELDQREWGAAADALAALGSPVRLALLRAVHGGAATVHDLAAREGVGSTGQLYHHLGQLLTAGWLVQPARGRYAIPPARLVPLLAALMAGGLV